MPPVLVPATRSKQSPIRRLGSLAAAFSLVSSTVRMRAGIRPRRPPPSIDRMRKNFGSGILPLLTHAVIGFDDYRPTRPGTGAAAGRMYGVTPCHHRGPFGTPFGR